MAKLKNVTPEEFQVAENAVFEVAQIVADLHRRASQGYADTVTNPISFASSFGSVSRTLAEMSAYFIMKAGIDEQRRETEAEIKKRIAG